MIKAKYGKDATNVGDEGGFAPNILENNEGETGTRLSLSPQPSGSSQMCCCSETLRSVSLSTLP